MICAKRTQFLDCGLRIEYRPAAGRPPCGLPPPACGGQSAQNKPNSKRSLKFEGTRPKANCARYPTIPVFSHSTIPRQTNPISGRAEGRISSVWIRSCDEWDTGEAVKKQSQFFDCGLRIADWGFRKTCGPPPELAGLAVQTNPISAAGKEEASAVQERSYGELRS